jgi:hypothetical protein
MIANLDLNFFLSLPILRITGAGPKLTAAGGKGERSVRLPAEKWDYG